jgi:polar amino acid transport system substrate-binding protein
MRRILVTMAALGLLAAACGGNGGNGSSPSAGSPIVTLTPVTLTPGPTSPGAATGSPVAETPETCTESAQLLHPGRLTVATDNPAFQPWFGGNKGAGRGPWKADPNSGTGNPYTSDGYESAVAYAVATQMGFTAEQVDWVPVPFNNSYKPGPKDFDFYIGQVSYSPERANAVDFSDNYYNVQQALVADKDSDIAHATTFADLQDAQLGAQLGTTSYQYIVDNIKPSKQPSVYDNSNDVIAALNAHQIDGYLVDAPTAYVNVLIGEAKNGVVVGQFPTIGEQEFFGLVLAKGSSLTRCVNLAIAILQGTGMIDSLQHRWLKDITFPEIKPS